MKQFIDTRCDLEELMIFVDGYDSLMVNQAEQALELFANSGAELLVSSENSDNHQNLLFRIYFENIFGKKSCLNTGMYMGKMGRIKEWIDFVYKHPEDTKSNQQLWNNALKRWHPSWLKIDTNNDLFLNISSDHVYSKYFPISKLSLVAVSAPSLMKSLNQVCNEVGLSIPDDCQFEKNFLNFKKFFFYRGKHFQFLDCTVSDLFLLCFIFCYTKTHLSFLNF